MNAITWLFRLAFFLLVLWFALKNTAPVAVRFTEDLIWADVPLIVVMLACVCVGALGGAAALAGKVFRLRRELATRDAPAFPARPPTTVRHDLPADELAEAARNIGAVGQLDADTRMPR